MQRVPSTVTDTSLNWEVGIVYQCTTCNKIELSFDDKLRACAIPICNGVMTESAQLVLANFRDMLIYRQCSGVQRMRL